MAQSFILQIQSEKHLKFGYYLLSDMHLSGITRFTLVDMTSNILENIERFVHQITFIDEERKILLNLLSDSIYEQLQQQKTISLAFICTHNSRRSHLAQMWFWIACQRFGLTKKRAS